MEKFSFLIFGLFTNEILGFECDQVGFEENLCMNITHF